MSHYLHVSARTVEARRHGIPEDRMGDHEPLDEGDGSKISI